MAKRTPEVEIRTFGIYSQWDKRSKDLPKLIEPTTRVPATIDIEFGFIAIIKNAKNRELDFCIDHPGILDANGKRRAPFDGTVYIKSNDWKFYLGDTIWAPIADKLGIWRMWLEIDGKVVADKSFDIFDNNV